MQSFSTKKELTFLPLARQTQKHLDKLIAAYDEIMGKRVLHNVKRRPPTESSIARINRQFGITLPASIIYFSQNSRYFHSGLGKDFDDPLHMLSLNRYCRKKRRRALRGQGRYPGQWVYSLPRYLIVLWGCTLDEDYICLDARQFDASTGEYVLTYWSPPRYEGNEPCYSSFIDYIQQIIDWNS